MIDPIGYQIELETYVAKIMRGRANLYVTLVGYVISASMFFHFFVDPHKALTVRVVLQTDPFYSRVTRYKLSIILERCFWWHSRWQLM